MTLSLSPFSLAVISLLSPVGRRRETKGSDHPRGLLSSCKTKVPRAKTPFLQQCHLLWLGLGLASGTRSDVSQGTSLEMQKENIPAVLPSAGAFPLGNLLPCWMYKKRSLLGGLGVCVGLFSVQGPNYWGRAFSVLYGKTAKAHLGFYGRGGM